MVSPSVNRIQFDLHINRKVPSKYPSKAIMPADEFRSIRIGDRTMARFDRCRCRPMNFDRWIAWCAFVALLSTRQAERTERVIFPQPFLSRHSLTFSARRARTRRWRRWIPILSYVRLEPGRRLLRDHSLPSLPPSITIEANLEKLLTNVKSNEYFVQGNNFGNR